MKSATATEVRSALASVVETYEPSRTVRFKALTPFKDEIRNLRVRGAAFVTIAEILKSHSVKTSREGIRQFYRATIDGKLSRRKRSQNGKQPPKPPQQQQSEGSDARVLRSTKSKSEQGRHGECKQWNDKGELLGSFEMRRGTGISKQWFPNGRLAFEASVVNELFTGRLRCWNEAGVLVQDSFFLENRRVPRDEYDRSTQTDSSLPTYDEESNEPVHERRNTGRGGHEKMIARLLSSRTANAMEWLKASASDTTRTLGKLNNSKSVLLVNTLREAGAVDVLAVDIDEDAKGNQHADKLVIVMPTDQNERRAIRAKCARRKIEFSPGSETGYSHLAIILG